LKYTTGEIAKITNVSVRTVQFYDKKGIVCPSEISEGGRRLYSESDLERFKTVCFLRELDLSLKTIGELIKEDNSKKVIDLLLTQHEEMLKSEISEKRKKLERLERFKESLQSEQPLPVNSIFDVNHNMDERKKLKKLRVNFFLMMLPLALVEIGSILLWIFTGVWWPFVVFYIALGLPYGIILSIKYYFKRVAYVCPECNHVFKPSLKKAFWANHTPNTRKLTCPNCGKKSFCVEVYSDKNN